ncbi:hypothetical protein GGR56DRAFT_677802 [Xylariaceae sp. FL0804]|nr:hypothetical protein GGR56DRAFT_677802 [Xylariaceae sp. FL0804]
MSSGNFGHWNHHSGHYNQFPGVPNFPQPQQPFETGHLAPSAKLAKESRFNPNLPSRYLSRSQAAGSQIGHDYRLPDHQVDMPVQPPLHRSRSRSPAAPHQATPRIVRKRDHEDDIVTPSAASGGVPDPTAEYMVLASHPTLMLPHPRKILVVIDLNGTLLYRPNKRNPTRFIERPYARAFLAYCIRTFTVVIWSSARFNNVDNMCKALLTPEQRKQVVAILTRDDFGLTSSDYNQRVQCYKRLTRLWNKPNVAKSHPEAAAGKNWSQLDTVLVDDSLEKARSEPYNLIQLPEFEGDSAEPDFILPQVHDYLNECSQQANISAYMREIPFKLTPGFKLH